MVQDLLHIALLLLIAVILFQLIYRIVDPRCSFEENFEEYRENTNESLKENMESRDGIDEGFEDRNADELKMLRYRLELWIQPTLKHFLAEYKTNRDVEEKYRLQRHDRPVSAEERRGIVSMVERVIAVKSSDIHENTRPEKGETSYTINKDQIYMCLRNSNGENHDHHILLFAFIHELAHVGCEDVGHTDEFWAHFRSLLYILCNYTYPGQRHKPPIKYCELDLKKVPYHNYCNSMRVFYNPLFDKDAFMTY